MTIYIDVIIVENLIMNYIILYATGTISKVKISYLRIFCSSLIGAIYAITEYTFKLNIYSNIIIKTILSVIIIYVAFNPQNIKKNVQTINNLLRNNFHLWRNSNILNICTKTTKHNNKKWNVCRNICTKSNIYRSNNWNNYIIYSIQTSKKQNNKKDMICKIKIKINGKEKTLDAMVDTGNMLKEPITGTPVAVVERTSLYDLLPKEILNNTESILGGDFKNIPEDIKREYIPKLKIIPFASLGKQNGMLVGIKPEKIEIINEQTEENKNAIIGIYNKSLTKKGEYNALIGIELY